MNGDLNELTPEEIEAIGHWGQALSLCREDAAGRCGISGTVKCPACGGKLNYAVAATNGHLWAKCKTGGCLSWMK